MKLFDWKIRQATKQQGCTWLLSFSVGLPLCLFAASYERSGIPLGFASVTNSLNVTYFAAVAAYICTGMTVLCSRAFAGPLPQWLSTFQVIFRTNCGEIYHSNQKINCRVPRLCSDRVNDVHRAAQFSCLFGERCSQVDENRNHHVTLWI